MKILALRADSGGCAFYRIQEPARVVVEQFNDVEIEVRSDINVEARRDAHGRHTVDEVHEDVDLMVIQRPLAQGVHAAAVKAKEQGIAVVVELDDDFQTVHPHNPAYREVDPKESPWSNHEWLLKTCELADWVTVSTPALTKYAPHGRVSVLRNCVPQSIFDIRPKNPKRGLGWTGTVATHPTDLQATAGGVGKALKDFNEHFYVVGDGNLVAQGLQLDPMNKVRHTGWVPLEEYYQTIADNISVGIVPLEISPFNEAKSALKGLEMGALGIPFVASPTSEYISLSKQGVGEIATTPAEWTRKVSKWLDDGKRRTAASQRYKKQIQKHFVYENNAHQWYDAWVRALEHHRHP